MTHFNHNHRERKNVCFLTKHSLVQDLWRGPPRGVAMLERGALYRTWVSSNFGETKIHNACTTRVIHKDVVLARCQRSDTKRRLEQPHTPFRSA